MNEVMNDVMNGLLIMKHNYVCDYGYDFLMGFLVFIGDIRFHMYIAQRSLKVGSK